MRQRIAFISTGGTIASTGAGPLDISDYDDKSVRITAAEILALIPEVSDVADVLPVNFDNSGSNRFDYQTWKSLWSLCTSIAHDEPDLAGIVIGHGTSTLEETAYFLGLTLKVQIPVVIVGALRPISALSSDAGLNLVNAARAAVAPESRGRGVLVVLNDEIYAAREVIKANTSRVQAFIAPGLGCLGSIEGGRVCFYRRVERQVSPNTEFDVASLDDIPRVDIAYAYAGADGSAIEAFVRAGAAGIVSAGFPPGLTTPAQELALEKARDEGVAIVQSSRAGSGRVLDGVRLARCGFIAADNLIPQKARILLALGLTVTSDLGELRRIFATY